MIPMQPAAKPHLIEFEFIQQKSFPIARENIVNEQHIAITGSSALISAIEADLRKAESIL